MKIELEVKDKVLYKDYCDKGMGCADLYKDGEGVYALIDGDYLIGFVCVTSFYETDGEKKARSREWTFPEKSIVDIAVAKENEHFQVALSEAVCKMSDIVSTDKANTIATLKHIEQLLSDIAGNRGNGISEKTLLAALEIVKGNNNKE